MKLGQRKLIRLAVLAMLLLSGCADNRPLNHRALVLALGFAPAPRGQISMIFQIPTPAGLARPSMGGGKGESSPTTFTLVGTGPTVARAFSSAQADLNKDLYFGQLQTLILSTHLSARQFGDIASTLARWGTLDKTAYTLATPANVPLVLSTRSKTTPLAPLYVSTGFWCTHCPVVDLKRQIWNLEQAQFAPAQDLWLPGIQPIAVGFQIQPIVLYRGNRVARILTPHQTTLLGYVLGRTNKGTVDLRWHGRRVSVDSLRAEPQLSARWQRSRLYLHVNLTVTGNIYSFPIPLAVEPRLTWLDQAVKHVLTVQCRALLQSLGRQGLDPFQWGDAFVWQHPHGLKTWLHAYRHAVWIISAHVQLRELGDNT